VRRALARMHLVQILLPVSDNDGQRLGREPIEAVERELLARFGGSTAYLRAPARGLWSEDGQGAVSDDVVVVEVVVDDLDRAWWDAYRRELEARFRQETIMVRAIAVEPL
jgi:hypothetical protein